MAATLTKILLHVTFSTKHREALITPDLEPELFAYTGGICRRMGSPLLSMNGTSDHVHMFVGLGKTVSLSELLLNVKRDSSRWFNDRLARGGRFAWQEGYFAFSIGPRAADSLRRYIARQKEHHKRVDFKDEMRTFLRKYDLSWDEESIWK